RQAAWALGVTQGTLHPSRPPAWQGPAAQVLDPGEEVAVGQAVRQQYVSVREQTHPGAFRS
ncbi:sugar kinase, partial [Streptomyces fructofermentans]